MSENPLVFLTASEIRFGRGKACEVAVTAKGFGQRAMLVTGATAARATGLEHSRGGRTFRDCAKLDRWRR